MPPEAPIPAEFLAQYDAERARVLRRRAIWYCAVMLAIIAYGWWSTISDLLDADRYPVSPGTASADIIFTTIFTLIFGRATVYFARRPRSRAEIVRAFQWLILICGLALAVVLDLLRHAPWSADTLPLRTPDDDLAQASASLLVLFIMHFISSLLVALSPREALAPLLPVLGAFALWVLLVSVGPPGQKAVLVAVSPLAGLPGLAWSWWRYRSFAERFNARAIQRRYTEVTRELTDARRVHEALFPPPLSRGPVRVRYHYEPMREIGGDFLFVRPLSFPPSAPAGPVLAVLIDVTGHGIAAALAVNRLHDELGRLCVGRIAGPREVILALNSFIAGSLAPTGMFATAIAIMVEPGAQACVRWAGAGHPPAFLRTPDGRVERLESTAPMLGVLDAELFECDEGRADMPPGATVIAYTDGVNEAKDSGGAMLGLPAVEALIARGPGAGAAPAEPATVADALAAAVRSHRADQPTDDTLIVELTPQAESTEPEAQARSLQPAPGRVP